VFIASDRLAAPGSGRLSGFRSPPPGWGRGPCVLSSALMSTWKILASVPF